MELVFPATVTHFTVAEIKMGRIIPPELYYNILPTVLVLNDLREWYGKPIIIHSTYRSPEYNKAVGGKPKSLHLKFNAIDWTVKRISDLEMLYNKLDEWDRANLYAYAFGLELYERGNFIHLDTRGLFGMRRARWNGT